MKQRSYYIEKRNKYTPTHIKTIFILESPPQSGAYFYDSAGRTTEPLFAAMMNLIGVSPPDRPTGLAAFSDRGLVIVDATYDAVNKYRGKYRDDKIIASYPSLVRDLTDLTHDKKTPLILVKSNVCRLLEERLKSDGFHVANNGIIIPFPGTGQ